MNISNKSILSGDIFTYNYMQKNTRIVTLIWAHIHLLISGLGVGPAIEIVDIVVSDCPSITEFLLAVHAQGLMI